MSAFMLVLVAGLTVGSDGTERISKETEKCLRLDGVWEGTHQYKGNVWKVRLEGSAITFTFDVVQIETSVKIVDEGKGKLWIQMKDNDARLGIYEQEANLLIICCRSVQGRPAQFSADKGDALLILRPVKPPRK